MIERGTTDFAARRMRYATTQISTVLPSSVALRLREVAQTAAHEDANTVSRNIDAVILAVNDREQGLYWQSEQIEFLQMSPSARIGIKDKRKAPAAESTATPEADLIEIRRLLSEAR
jgi:hypothetical protein